MSFSQSSSNIAKELGHETFTSDIKQFGKTDYVVDIMDFTLAEVPFVPNVLWASPPCTTLSVASIGHHWTKGYKPKTDEAKFGIKMIRKMWASILLANHNAVSNDKKMVYYIENPRGMIRKLGIMNNSWRKEVTYCSYGDKRMKPTDIWTNDFNWIPRTMCHNGNKNCHHESAPRGSKTGTQGLKNAYERSKVPRELCLEILERK